jgi:hypothetical protein
MKASFSIETFRNGKWTPTDMADSLAWALLSQGCYEYRIGIPSRIVSRKVGA